MISEEVLEKIAERKGIPKEKLEQALIDVSEGKEKQTSMLELLDELPKEKIKNDKEMQQVYKKLKQIFEE